MGCESLATHFNWEIPCSPISLLAVTHSTVVSSRKRTYLIDSGTKTMSGHRVVTAMWQGNFNSCSRSSNNCQSLTLSEAKLPKAQPRLLSSQPHLPTSSKLPDASFPLLCISPPPLLLPPPQTGNTSPSLWWSVFGEMKWILVRLSLV